MGAVVLGMERGAGLLRRCFGSRSGQYSNRNHNSELSPYAKHWSKLALTIPRSNRPRGVCIIFKVIYLPSGAVGIQT